MRHSAKLTGQGWALKDTAGVLTSFPPGVAGGLVSRDMALRGYLLQVLFVMVPLFYYMTFSRVSNQDTNNLTA